MAARSVSFIASTPLKLVDFDAPRGLPEGSINSDHSGSRLSCAAYNIYFELLLCAQFRHFFLKVHRARLLTESTMINALSASVLSCARLPEINSDHSGSRLLHAAYNIFLSFWPSTESTTVNVLSAFVLSHACSTSPPANRTRSYSAFPPTSLDAPRLLRPSPIRRAGLTLCYVYCLVSFSRAIRIPLSSPSAATSAAESNAHSMTTALLGIVAGTLALIVIIVIASVWLFTHCHHRARHPSRSRALYPPTLRAELPGVDRASPGIEAIRGEVGERVSSFALHPLRSSRPPQDFRSRSVRLAFLAKPSTQGPASQTRAHSALPAHGAKEAALAWSCERERHFHSTCVPANFALPLRPTFDSTPLDSAPADPTLPPHALEAVIPSRSIRDPTALSICFAFPPRSPAFPALEAHVFLGSIPFEVFRGPGLIHMDLPPTLIVDTSLISQYLLFCDFTYYSHKSGQWLFKEPYKVLPERSPVMLPLVPNVVLTTIQNDLLEAIGDYNTLADAASDTMRRRQCDQVVDRAALCITVKEALLSHYALKAALFAGRKIIGNLISLHTGYKPATQAWADVNNACQFYETICNARKAAKQLKADHRLAEKQAAEDAAAAEAAVSEAAPAKAGKTSKGGKGKSKAVKSAPIIVDSDDDMSGEEKCISSLIQSFNAIRVDVDTEVSVTGGVLGTMKFTKTKLAAGGDKTSDSAPSSAFRTEKCLADNTAHGHHPGCTHTSSGMPASATTKNKLVTRSEMVRIPYEENCFLDKSAPSYKKARQVLAKSAPRSILISALVLGLFITMMIKWSRPSNTCFDIW
ncbi:hypothetical protein C8R44DRAFT_880175 [Mycena epipterygia]|nr:hypothetical protein C8R44DRAFT_880175 [Mycena epipterygia]